MVGGLKTVCRWWREFFAKLQNTRSLVYLLWFYDQGQITESQSYAISSFF